MIWMVLSLKKHEKHLQHQSQEAPALTRSERLVGVNFGHHLFFFRSSWRKKRGMTYIILGCVYIYYVYIYNTVCIYVYVYVFMSEFVCEALNDSLGKSITI
jgi:hypothetical protein